MGTEDKALAGVELVINDPVEEIDEIGDMPDGIVVVWILIEDEDSGGDDGEAKESVAMEDKMVPGAELATEDTAVLQR